MHQQLSLIGYLGKDPETRYTADGTPVTSFSVATSRKWTDASGQQQERTVWFRVAAWRKLAEVAGKYLTKGKLVYVEGTLTEPKPYQTKTGEWRASLDVTADLIKFLSGGSGDATHNAAPAEPTFQDEQEIPF
jgi:single-strand DNA-binding protein